MKTKILCVFCGGTIGSLVTENGISPQNVSKSLLIEKFLKRFPEYVDKLSFESVYPLNKLSENMELDDWKKIIRLLQDYDFSGISAVFIAHGSDTLGYFAAMLSAFLSDFPIPIFVVASDKVLTDNSANGLINFKAAADIVLSGAKKGVYVPYKNKDDDAPKIHLGYQITQSQILGSDFFSANAKPIAADREAFLRSSVRVIPLECAVGVDFSFLSLKPGDRVLLRLYHGGTAPVKDVSELLKRAEKANAEVYAASLTSGEGEYASTAELKKLGLKFFEDITFETAYAFLLSKL